MSDSNRPPLLRIQSNDTVAVALMPLQSGSTQPIHDSELLLLEDIGQGHKVALCDIKKGNDVIKYGVPIGRAIADIQAGAAVHVHNLKTNLSGLEEYSYNPVTPPVFNAPATPRTFQGYQRDNGEVGIRNEVWIVPLVGCVNGLAENMVRQLSKTDLPENVDALVAYPHPYGCSQLGEDHESTQQILANLVHHPNAGAVLVLGLGCENNNLKEFAPILGDVNPDRVKFLVAQDVDNEIEEGEKLLKELITYAAKTKRSTCPVSKLRIGLKCGGSDGFSGITANPLVGEISDLLLAQGATSVLSEVPEMFGAEQILMDRCITKEVFSDCVTMINDFKAYFVRHKQEIYENPSPGNKEGGISTLEEKSLGCTQKGGNGLVVDVLKYGERLSKPGLNLLAGPGNDIVATTVLTAAGAHCILFTTGRGTPLGSPIPVVKISTNSELAQRKSHWIDFDAGQLLSGKSLPELGQDLFDYILDLASGKCETTNEKQGYRDISILKDGVTL